MFPKIMLKAYRYGMLIQISILNTNRVMESVVLELKLNLKAF